MGEVTPVTKFEWMPKVEPLPPQPEYSFVPATMNGNSRADNDVREVAMRFLNDGQITPLEVMVANMRYAMGRAMDAQARLQGVIDAGSVIEIAEAVKHILTCRKLAQDFAVDAAPYMHPKLAMVKHITTDNDLDRFKIVITPDDSAL